MQDGFVKLGAETVNLRSIEAFGTVCVDGEPSTSYARFAAGGDRQLSESQLRTLQEVAAAGSVLTGIMTLTDISGDRIIVNLSKIEVFEPDQRVLYVAGRPFMLSQEAVGDLLSVLDYTSAAMA